MNKRNGKVASVLVMYLDDDGHMQTDGYDKVEDLMADYAAYEQAKPEPLIKDKKIRKAVRAWAELNCSHKLHQFNDYQLEDENNYLIEFADSCLTNLKIGKNYTIAELCGEEEE